MLRCLIAIAGLVLAAPTASATDLMPADGERIVFDVYRNGGTPFGTHAVEFTRDGQDILASISIELRAGLGPVTVFRYRHESSERWRDGQLVGFSGRTQKDGETYQVQAMFDGEGLEVDGVAPDGAPVDAEYAASLLPSSHWRGYPPGMDAMFNTEHGTLMQTDVQFLGEEQIEADGGVITASRYRLSSSLTVDLWYDENGRWAGCEFEARGQRVRYVRRADPVRS